MRGVVDATRMLQADEHLQLMLASAPGEVATELTIDGLPRIFGAATLFLTPVFAPHIGREASARLAEWLARVVISYFLAPSRFVDLATTPSATAFVRTFVLPAFPLDSPPGGNRHVVHRGLIGRADVNDVEAILAITNTDVDEVTHAVPTTPTPSSRGTTAWPARRCASSTRRPRPASGTARPTCPWDTEVDQEAIVVANARPAIAMGAVDGRLDHYIGSPVEKWGEKEWIEFGIQSQNWTLSRSSCTASRARCSARPRSSRRCRGTTPSSTPPPRSMDEARHVEVFATLPRREARRPLPDQRPPALLLDDIVNDSRWDMTYLGMQIMVEGLALAAFGFMHQMTTEPLLKQLLRYVMSDEARHVAFGVLSLQEVYDGHDRRRDPRAPGVRLRGRGAHARPVPAARGVGAHGRRADATIIPLRPGRPDPRLFQQMLFSKIVPNCKKLGLLDAADGWLRDRFTELGVIQFEDWADTGEEYGAFALDAGTTTRRAVAASSSRARPSPDRRREARALRRNVGAHCAGTPGSLRWHRDDRTLRRCAHRDGHAVRCRRAPSTSTRRATWPAGSWPTATTAWSSPARRARAPMLTDDEQLVAARGGARGGRRPRCRRHHAPTTPPTPSMSRPRPSKLGVAGVLAVVPVLQPAVAGRLEAHFRAVAAATDLPVMLYDIPIRTGRKIATETLLRLAREVPNIVALKDAAGNPAETAPGDRRGARRLRGLQRRRPLDAAAAGGRRGRGHRRGHPLVRRRPQPR